MSEPATLPFEICRQIGYETDRVNADPAAKKTMVPGDCYPAGLVNAFVFATFNALSFQMVLGSPMILYAKSLGASATILGIIAGMMPMLVIFQIPAAHYVVRVGYKRFVYGGWGIRVLFIGIMAFVPVMGFFLNATTRLALMLMLLFGFNLSRGISSCAWLPWITSLIPVSLRGRYLATETACVNVASTAAFTLAALCLGAAPQPWQFSVIFAFSAAMGLISLVFLKRIPEGESPQEIQASTTPVPWRDIAGYTPFRKLLRLYLAWSAAYGGLVAFIVAYLKTEVRMTEGNILLISATMFLGGLGSLWFVGPRLDRLGNKPLLSFSLGLWLALMAGWCLLAAHTLVPRTVLLVGLHLVMGLAIALVNLSLLRLAMATIPVMGRNHFFALYSVVGNLTQGIAPVLWGMMIDAVGPLEIASHGFEWNRFSLFFLAIAGVFVVALYLAQRVDEPQAKTVEHLLRELLISPMRTWFRLWPRS